MKPPTQLHNGPVPIVGQRTMISTLTPEAGAIIQAEAIPFIMENNGERVRLASIPSEPVEAWFFEEVVRLRKRIAALEALHTSNLVAASLSQDGAV